MTGRQLETLADRLARLRDMARTHGAAEVEPRLSHTEVLEIVTALRLWACYQFDAEGRG